ncbi:MAG: hypothetical protein IJN81_01295 [Clostridia bacterium]|nr:hypothetical protein [Clostridia bacterium]
MLKTITTEYKNLLSKRVFFINELSVLPNGYISKKNINGNEYCYLQCRVHGKVTSVYIKSENVDSIDRDLKLRKKYESELSDVEKRLVEIREAVKLLDSSFIRKLDMLELSAGMDEIADLTKTRCVTFADAMTSIEGVPVSKTAKEELDNWLSGKATFISVFESTLKRYGFPVEV